MRRCKNKTTRKLLRFFPFPFLSESMWKWKKKTPRLNYSWKRKWRKLKSKLFPLNAKTKTRPSKLLQSTKLRAYLLKLKPTIDQQIYLVTSPKFLFRVVQINLQTLRELLMRDILEPNLKCIWQIFFICSIKSPQCTDKYS